MGTRKKTTGSAGLADSLTRYSRPSRRRSDSQAEAVLGEAPSNASPAIAQVAVCPICKQRGEAVTVSVRVPLIGEVPFLVCTWCARAGYGLARILAQLAER
jgi:hypothetical protein